MKTTTRFLYGIVSSLLLAAGFVRAADSWDPMSRDLGSTADSSLASLASEPCGDDGEFDDPPIDD